MYVHCISHAHITYPAYLMHMYLITLAILAKDNFLCLILCPASSQQTLLHGILLPNTLHITNNLKKHSSSPNKMMDSGI